MQKKAIQYFPYELHLSADARRQLDFERIWAPLRLRRYPPVIFFRRLSSVMQAAGTAVTAGKLTLYSTLLAIYRYLIDSVGHHTESGLLADAVASRGISPEADEFKAACHAFEEYFPPLSSLEGLQGTEYRHIILREMLLLDMASQNMALESFRWILDDKGLASASPYPAVTAAMKGALADSPRLEGLGVSLIEAIFAPVKASPESLAGQLAYIRDTWGAFIPAELFSEVLTAFDILEEEERPWSDGGSGPSQVLSFGGGAAVNGVGDAGGGQMDPSHVAGYDQPEYEAFSPDADWMSNVVLIAKMTHVWLDQLSQVYGYPVSRLDQIPDSELDVLAARGFTGLWLIGLWERSEASRRIKEICGNPEAHASAYSLYDYTIAADLGGEEAFLNLKSRAWKRGIRLASDMVPNHTGIYSRWVIEHPDWFIQTDYPQFPTYSYNGEDLSRDPAVTLQIEDGYWTKHDAAVAFRMIDRRDGRTRYIYHGNDGTSIPWNDTAQLNYLIPEVREAVMQTILHVARLTPIIRFDAAMTLAKKHYQRLWFPQRGLGGGIPSRAEHAMGRDEFDAVFPVEFWREVVDRVAAETPGTLLLAEAFWMMEGYFVRTLGMHRVYNSAFMNMLKAEENAKYRQTIRNVLEFNPEILKRFVNFMNNPDEKTAVEQFGSQGKYFGACLLMATMPGLPMFGHGQVEGFREKYGMEYRKAYWDETVDEGLLKGHEFWIFPLLRKRWLFSGSERFELYNFYCNDGSLDENVFAYSNMAGGERAVVLYNNRHGLTSGWIKDASAVARKVDGGDSELQKNSLGRALNLPAENDCHIAFRDLATGLVYLRNSLDIHENGLYAELGEYEFHLFWEFRELRDETESSWAPLCTHLAGRGVHSVEEELVQLENLDLIEAFDDLLDSLEAAFAAKAFPDKRFSVALAEFVGLLPADVAEDISMDKVLNAIELLCNPQLCSKALKRLRASGVKRREFRFVARDRRAAVASTIIRHLLLPLGDNPVFAYGLQRRLASLIAGDDRYERGWGHYQAERSLAVAVASDIWSSPLPQGDGERLISLFAEPDLARFLLLHDDGGISWFNKERFEELLCWLALSVAFDRACGKNPPELPGEELKNLAAASGYRVKSFIRLAEASLPENL